LFSNPLNLVLCNLLSKELNDSFMKGGEVSIYIVNFCI